MLVFLTGATGYIGSAVAAELLRAGHRVRGLTRSPERAAELKSAGLEPVVGELARPETYAVAAAGCDAAVHLGYEPGPRTEEVDRAALTALLAAARGAGPLMAVVYTSGVWVLGARRGGPAVEEDPPAPLSVVSWRPALESAALTAGGGALAVAVVRPGCVYGGRGGLYGRMLLAAVEDHEVPLVGNGRNAWAAVYLDDLARLYRLVLERRAQGLFHATDGASEPLLEVAESFLEAAGGGSVSVRPLSEALREMGPFAEGLAIDQRVSSAKARDQLGWRPQLDSVVRHAPELLAQWHERAGPLSVA